MERKNDSMMDQLKNLCVQMQFHYSPQLWEVIFLGACCVCTTWAAAPSQKNRRKTSETKKNSTVVSAQAQIAHQTCFYRSFYYLVLFFFLSCQISREDVPLWMIYKAVCISFSWHWSTHVISAHFLLQSCFIQCKAARFLRHITLMSQQKISSRPQ